MNKFILLKNKLGELIKQSEVESDYQHSIATCDWVLKLFSEASEELQIAALAHDLDRAVPPRVKRKENEKYDEYKQRHAQRSAQLIATLMKKYGYKKKAIDKVVHYVENHETGGDDETNILTDADSISYFFDNIELYLSSQGYKCTKDKIKFMYIRASERSKKIVSQIQFNPQISKVVQDAIKEVI